MSTFQKQANKLACRWISKKAGWWNFDPNEGPGITAWKGHPAGDGGTYLNGDQPADVMDQAFHDIEDAYTGEYGIGRLPTSIEMQAVFDFCFGGWKKRMEEKNETV